MIRNLLQIVAFVGAVQFIGLTKQSARDAVVDACVRPRLAQFAVGRTYPLRTASVQCTVRFAPTAVTLTTGEQVSNIAAGIARSASGTFYSATGRGEISEWDPQGRWLRNIGRTGNGPGEYAAGALTLITTSTNQLFVFSNNRVWTTLDAGLRFVRSAPMQFPVSAATSMALGDGSLLVSERRSDVNNYFTVLRADSASGALPLTSRSYGEMSASDRALMGDSRVRQIAPVSDTSFWTTPPKHGGRGYQLQE